MPDETKQVKKKAAKPEAKKEQDWVKIKPQAKAKKEVVVKATPGLDWAKIQADFEAVYDPTKGPQLAGRQIARIVVVALIELAQNK